MDCGLLQEIYIYNYNKSNAAFLEEAVALIPLSAFLAAPLLYLRVFLDFSPWFRTSTLLLLS
jgi:hypothetical protein